MTSSRRHADFISAYIATVSERGEAPARFHFWTAVSTIAGALRRRVYIDMGTFRWYPNFYIVLIGPPGTVKKSTTISVGARLLREIRGINFGADCTTWQDFVKQVAEAQDMFAEGDQPDSIMEQTHTVTSALTLTISELGTFLNPDDPEMINVLTELWDCKIDTPFIKSTKTQGSDTIMNPFVNLIAGTTPKWMHDNFRGRFGGWGLSSRCIFLHCDTVARYVPYPDELWGAEMHTWRESFVDDLAAISRLSGVVTLDAAARDVARPWYETHMRRIVALNAHPNHDPWLSYYLARKWDHIHKLAMVLAVSQSDRLVITEPILHTAIVRCNEIEDELSRIFGAREATRQTRLNLDVAAGIQNIIEKSGGAALEFHIYNFTRQYMTYGEATSLINHLIVARYLRKAQDANGTWLALGENATPQANSEDSPVV